MTDKEQYITAFKTMVEQFLAEYSDDLDVFFSYMGKNDFRQAYLVWHEFNQRRGLPLQPKMKKTEEAFYWFFVN